jgi:hypothetical protein
VNHSRHPGAVGCEQYRSVAVSPVCGDAFSHVPSSSEASTWSREIHHRADDIRVS